MLQGASLMFRQQRCDDHHITLAELTPLSALCPCRPVLACPYTYTDPKKHLLILHVLGLPKRMRVTGLSSEQNAPLSQTYHVKNTALA
jgi:hypothetical protein